jgi:parallel beta-helix repeat protein
LILLALIMISVLAMRLNVGTPAGAEIGQDRFVSVDVEPSRVAIKSTRDGGQSLENAKVARHEITGYELEKLKERIGVWQKGLNYNRLIDGHGTGLRPPTDDEWEAIAAGSLVIDGVTLDLIESESDVDLSVEPWFPPIGNQDGEGSCTCWAVGYYVKTFQEAKEHGWNLSEATWEGGYYGYPTLAYQDRIMSPDFLYHLVNWGTDGGSSFYAAIELVCFVGVSSWEEMPYDPEDHVSWPSEEAWREAQWYRGNSSGMEYIFVDSGDGLNTLKNWIAAGNLAIIGVDGNQYSSMTDADFWTLDNYVDPAVNHANTIVGYDDAVEYVENGENRSGGFKVANSWGVGGWERINDGYFWISYEALKQRIGYCMVYGDVIGYEPELSAVFRIDHQCRDECDVEIGFGNTSSPIVTKSFSGYLRQSAYNNSVCANNIVFDITEFKDAVSNVIGQPFFMSVYDWDWPVGTTPNGTILHFAIDDTFSSDPPVATVNDDYVFVSLLMETIHIRGDGSISPSMVPIQRDGDLYTLTGNITDFDGIVVERDDMVLDGADFIVQGSGEGVGVLLSRMSNVTVSNMEIRGFSVGISLGSFSGATVNGIKMTNNTDGMRISGWGGMAGPSCGNVVSGNMIIDNENGIVMEGAVLGNLIEENVVANNTYFGMALLTEAPEHSPVAENVISGNTIADNGEGIYLLASSHNSISGNNITGGVVNHGSSNITISGNNLTGGIVFSEGLTGAGVYPSSNSTVFGNVIYGGISLTNSSGNTLSGNNITGGISLVSGSDNNTVCLNGVTGDIYLYMGSRNNSISENVVVGGSIACFMSGSNNSISGNSIVGGGISLVSDSCDNIVFGNNIMGASGDGIILQWLSSNNTIAGNIITNSGGCGVNLEGGDGGPLVDNRIVGNEIANSTGDGIRLSWSSNNTVSGNNVTDNEGSGIVLHLCSNWDSVSGNNTLVGNFVRNNGQYGIQVLNSSGDFIFLNSFVNNSLPVYSENSTNAWDNGFEGNYWSGYNGTDSNGDGIGDTPYTIDGNNTDNYPLMSPYEYWCSPILGDVNRDMKVDMRDIALCCGAFMAKPGDPRWNPNCDLNSDSKIDIRDIAIACQQFGQHYP